MSTKQQYGQALYIAASECVRKNVSDCEITLEVRDMVRETYIL